MRTSSKLLTPEIKHMLRKHPFCSQEGLGTQARVILRVFNPNGDGVWLITEAERQDNGDWLMFGCCDIPKWDWGYWLLSELNPSVTNLERDVSNSNMRFTVEELTNDKLCYNE